jgi:hypothetical protein
LIPTRPLQAARSLLDTAGIGKIPLTVPLGNIGIVARRPQK